MEEAGTADLVQRGRSSALAGGSLACWFDEAGRAGDLAVEVAGVELAVPDRLVDLAQLVDGERRLAESGTDGGVLQLRAGSLHCVAQNPVVVEGELARVSEQVVDGFPARVSGVGAGGRLGQVGNKSQVGNADHAVSWVASGCAVGGQLFEVDLEVGQAGLLS